MQPSKSYAPVFQATAAKLDLAIWAQRVLVEDQGADAAEVQARILSAGQAGTSGSTHSAQLLATVAPFLYGQLQALQQVIEAGISCRTNITHEACGGQCPTMLMWTCHALGIFCCVHTVGNRRVFI